MNQTKKKEFKPLPPKREGFGAIFNVKEPAPKMKKIRNNGSMGIAFNNNMLFPENFLDIVTESKLRNLEGDEAPLIEI